MSWSGGSEIFEELIWVVQKSVPDDDSRKEIYAHMIDVIEREDCDTLSECLGTDSAFDDAFAEKHPDEVEEDEDDAEELDFED